MADTTLPQPVAAAATASAPVPQADWRPVRPRRAGAARRAHGGRSRTRLSLAVLALVVGAALVLPWIDPSATTAATDEVDYRAVLQPPSAEHWLGTDDAGRDVLLRTALGVRVSLLVAVLCAVVAAALGCLVGALAGLVGGRVDRLVMRVVDAVNSVPHLLLGIVIVALYRGSLLAIVASIALTHWTSVARIVRSEVLTLRHRPYVDAAVLAGASRWQVLRGHVVPAVAPQALLATTLLLPHAVWHETTLSFLGLGLPAHLPSIGNLVNDARDDLLQGAAWTVAAPAGALVLVSLAVAGLGGAWRDRLVPRRRTEVGL
jgi:peptide/nickel transport system permease protein